MSENGANPTLACPKVNAQSQRSTSMAFRITGLQAAPFQALFGLSDEALAQLGACRVVADAKPGYPDRIELTDAEPGQTLLLINHTHLPNDGPYRSSHAIFVREGASQTFDSVDIVPQSLRVRTLSVRSFDEAGMMMDADLVQGTELEQLIDRLFADPKAEYLHVHNAKRGCYACRVDRA
jgi:hypothetical protein